jgi:hypothetical protein
MLNSLFLPFASTPATLHLDPGSPSIIEGFTLHYDAQKLNVRVDEANESKSIEIEIEAFETKFRPHMVEMAKDQWAIEFGCDRSVHTASIVGGKSLLFAKIPNESEARAVLHLIDLIIRVNQRHSSMIKDFADRYGQALQCEWQEDSSSLHIYGQCGNVSVYNINNLVLVYIQSDDESRIFERYLSREFAPAHEKNPYASYVLSYDGKHFPGAEYVEDEIYMFCFRYPGDEAQIRMLMDTVVDIIKACV